MSDCRQTTPPPQRAPRVALRGSISARIHLENRRQFAGRFHQLSLTGGLLELTVYIDERSQVALAFEVGHRLLQAKAEMLFPMRSGIGYLQPFRFSAFAPGARQALEMEIAALLRESFPQMKTVPPLRAGHVTGLRLPRFFLESF